MLIRPTLSVFLILLVFAGPEISAQTNEFQRALRDSQSFARLTTHSIAQEADELPESEVEFEEEESESPYDEPIETERHDFTQSSTVVGRGVFQVEYGFLFTTNKEDVGSEMTYSTPEILVRYGLTDRLEIRSRYNYAWKFRGAEEDGSGATDMTFSIKYQITEPERDDWRPETALEIRTSVPTGGEDFSTDRWYGGLDYIYGWKFGEYFTLTGSTGANQNALGEVAFLNPETDRGDTFIAWTQSVALGAKLTRQSTGYFEWFGIFTDGRAEGEKALNFLNFGIDYLLSKNTVVDVRVGWGLNEQTDDLFVGVGGAFRF